VSRADRSIGGDRREAEPDELISVREQVFGVMAATALLIFFVPILLITSIAIKIDSPGPIFVRETKSYRVVKAYKFRNPQRLTWLDLMLKQTGIDQLPQLLNVLRGEMSFTDLLRAGIFRL
jgi:polysaccharide biosynthesis protein PslA